MKRQNREIDTYFAYYLVKDNVKNYEINKNKCLMKRIMFLMFRKYVHVYICIHTSLVFRKKKKKINQATAG